ncbi:HDOD domain-containing protein [Idiomarina seosinensis]|uniref:EAL and HDOD domain-containing protein n=1 Tax=Idiomarina seosinensis TaxID=281739 RepID=UPI00384FE21C
MRNVLLAQQPIYDSKKQIIASELLYRNDQGLSAFDVGEHNATAELLYNLSTGLIDETSILDTTFFINVSADFLLSDVFLPVEPGRVVIELVERIQPSEEILTAIQRWKKLGYEFALDDFDYSPDWDAIIAETKIIKIDILQTSPAKVKALREHLKEHKLRWLAEKVETECDFFTYQQLGFELFQGYFLAKPSTVTGQKVPSSGTNLLSLIERVSDPDVNFKTLARLIQNEPELSIKLMKIAASPIYGRRVQFSSIQDVILRLGLEHIKKWVLLISAMNEASSGEAQLVLTRAYFCQALASKMSGVDENQAFISGLLSGVDILLKVDPKLFVKNLTLPDDINAALNGEPGSLNLILTKVKKAEAVLYAGASLTSQIELNLYLQQNNNVLMLLKEAT